MKICPTCQSQFTDDYAFCLNDGTTLIADHGQTAPFGAPAQTSAFCGQCSAPMSPDYAFCKSCGAPRRSPETQKKVVTTVGIRAGGQTWFEENKTLVFIMASVGALLLIGGLYFAFDGGNIPVNNSNTKNTRLTDNSNRASTSANMKANTMPTSSNSGKTGALLTDLHIRDQPNKYAMSLGIHFRGAKVQILDTTTYQTPEGEMSTWYRVKVFEYGCSADTSLGCGKNSAGDSDEGWMNSKYIQPD